MWRPRDHERYIGGYDPEHEMPDPDRDRGDRWQSDAYRSNSRDSRFAYRWDPDRFENRFGDRDRERAEYEFRWNRDARDRQFSRGDYDRQFSRSEYDRQRGGPDFDRGRDFGGRDDMYRGGGYDRDFSGRGPGRTYGADRGFDHPRGEYDRGGYEFDRGWTDRGDHGYDSGVGRWGSDFDRAREFGGRGFERDWRDRQRFDRDEYENDYDRWRNRR